METNCKIENHILCKFTLVLRQTFTTKLQQYAIIKSNTLYLLGLLGYRLSDNIYRVNKECPSHVSTMKIVPHS